MKKEIILAEYNQPLILGSYVSEQICDSIIDYFESDFTYKFEGVLGNDPRIDKTKKNSVDCALLNPLLSEYCKELYSVVDLYTETFPDSTKVEKWRIVEAVNIQKYSPINGGYHQLHCENSGIASSSRHLVFMTYLNDLDQGGETYFPNQKFLCKPKKGLTLIWPAYFSYPHKGFPSIETKYIVTGWFNFYNDNFIPNPLFNAII